MTEREQRLRNECGQQAHKITSMMQQRAEMQADLVAQREDMKEAIAALEAGSVRDALEILRGALAHRERTREKRKNG